MGISGTSLLVDFDLAGLLAELGAPAAGAGEDQDEVLAAEEAALVASPDTVVDLAGRVAGLLPSGAALAGWLTTVSTEGCSKADLAGVAAAYRRLASWAQAGELAAVAALASQFAADNPRVGVGDDGRPAQVPPEAAAQVGLALGMGKVTAGDWTHLAVQLRWQLRGTAAALSDGWIDLARARLIAEATALLTDEAAARVQDRVLPEAGQQTCGQLRGSLRRAVIAADPEGAEQRRKDAERRAKVSLYPDDEGTATLAGSSLPGIHAAAAMARITAMARALKASGASGGLDLLRANIFLGLLLGTVPLMPPQDGGPPDDPQPEDPEPPDSPQPPDDPQLPHDRRPQPPAGSGWPPDLAEPACWWPDIPPPGDADAPAADGGQPPEPTAPPAWWPGQDRDDEDPPGTGPAPPWPDLPAELSAAGFPARRAGSLRPRAGLLDVILPWSALTGASAEPGILGRIGPVTASQSRDLARLAMRGPDTEWRLILTDDDGRACAVERIRLGRAASAAPRAGPGTARPDHPAPDTRRPGNPAPDTRRPGNAAAGTAAAGTATAGAAADTTAVVGRATVTMRECWLAAHAEHLSDQGVSRDAADAAVLSRQRQPGTSAACPLQPGQSLLAPVLRAAERAVTRVRAERAANVQAAGGCAHSAGSAAYQPPPRLRDFIAARDLTCRFPPCGQPAWRSDLDHTVPFDQGGPTCSCNLGGGCRTHHKIKQLPGWKLEQPRPGYFIWTTPADLSYHVIPDRYPV